MLSNRTMMKLLFLFQRLKCLVIYKPFLKKCGYNFLIINPILITPKFISLGSKVFIRNNSRIEGVSNYGGFSYNPSIIIDDYVSIEQNLHLTCANKIVIGKNTAIASNVTITDINHPYEDIKVPPEQQPIEVSEVCIGEDCKIYNNVVVLPNSKIGKHCVVGANAVVIGKNYPDYSIIVGNPAKIIKRYSFEKNKWLRTDSEGFFLD